jgi:hypothetical protein
VEPSKACGGAWWGERTVTRQLAVGALPVHRLEMEGQVGAPPTLPFPLLFF